MAKKSFDLDKLNSLLLKYHTHNPLNQKYDEQMNEKGRNEYEVISKFLRWVETGIFEDKTMEQMYFEKYGKSDD